MFETPWHTPCYALRPLYHLRLWPKLKMRVQNIMELFFYIQFQHFSPLNSSPNRSNDLKISKFFSTLMSPVETYVSTKIILKLSEH